MNDDEKNPHLFWPLAVIGFGVMVYGVYGLLDQADRTRPSQWLKWFIGAAAAHDFVVAPIVIVVGMAVARYVPGWLRGPVQGALIVTGMLVLAVYPLVRGFGRRPADPSALPNNYAVGLLVVVVLVWIATSVVVLARLRKRGARRA